MNVTNSEIEVSVICLAYNHEKYIRQTLEGFVNQITSFKYEVIIHDDASTDGTRAIIEEYVKKYPDLFVPIYQEENQYSINASNITKAVYKMVRGKYVANCEGDDYWCDSNKLQLQYDALESHPECSICVHQVKGINADGSECDSEYSRMFPEKKYGIVEGVNEKERICNAFWKVQLTAYVFHTSSYFVRRRVHDERLELYDKDEWISYVNGDVSVLWSSLNRGDFYYIGKTMSKRRLEVPGSYTVRLKEANDTIRYERWRRRIKGLVLYDEYSQYKFHEYIQFELVNSIMRRIIVDLDDPIKILTESGISIRTALKYAKAHNKLFISAIYCCPSSVFLIRKMWKAYETFRA